MFKSKLSKVIVLLLRRVLGVTRSGAKRLMRAMLRSLMAMGRRAKLPVAGFVLPTVTMVLLVVILLTVAITLRSFDRANTARNVRVNQQVLAAATPALDRAKAKIQFMLREDPQRPTATPSDEELYRMISDSTGSGSGIDTYTFGDETRLKLKANLDSVAAISPDLKVTDAGFNLETNESINTAWRYPVDTNNDGKYDTFTLYGIFFRSPPRIPLGASAGEFTRARKPLEARTPPMSLGVLKKGCEAAAGNIASLVGDSSWYSINGRLLKSFFVYTVNVPIKDQAEAAAAQALDNTHQYLPFTGTNSISALEYQQDQSRIPLSNNAVVYEDDLEISPGPPVNINGRMITNSNLIVSGIGGDDNLKLYQVSSQNSCFYEQENSKILVGGNVVNGGSGDNFPSKTVEVHLFKKPDPIINQKISATVEAKKKGQSVDKSTALDVLYNNAAFQERIDLLVKWQVLKPITDDPLSVQKRPTTQSREQALENYFKLTTRKVPFAEVEFGTSGITGYGPPPTGTSPIEGSGQNLRPIEKWNLPTDANTQLNLNLNQLEATEIVPNKPIEEETYLGDRVVAGNSLPNKWWDSTKSELVSTEQPVAGKWNTDATKPSRTRTSQITQLADVGSTDRGNGLGEKTDADIRDGFWEASAAQIPKTAVDGIGGLRVITSAGVYDRRNSFLPPPVWLDAAGNRKEGPPTINDDLTPANTYDDPAIPGIQEFPVVWPDTMPMSPLGPGSKVYNNNEVAGSPRDLNWINFPGPTDGSGLPTGVAATTTSSVVEIAAENPQYAKGDLRMRASAVYHYAEEGYKADDIVPPAQPVQKPIACVSSYYDPSSYLTALNLDGLANVSGQGADSPAVLAGLPALGGTQPKFIGSNNGITYPAPKTARPTGASTPGANGLLTGGDPVLDNQANLVFPDGRFANGPLRSALQVLDTNRTLAQKAAIDSTLCALDILKGDITPDPAKIPHGAIQEVAFLNAREIKAVDRDDPTTKVNEAFTLSSPLTGPEAAKLTGDYNQPVEERQPLEIRATQIDLDQLRKKTIDQTNATGPSPEYLLPNSGIIYASRDDALPDRSNRTGDEKTSKRVSPSDSLLDPTRKPNGIVLINGKELFRGTTPDVGSVTDLVKQKGLILVSNVPVYIKGEFNLHTGGITGQEFEQPLTGDWTTANFYEDRVKLNDSFACRKGDPRLKNCAGDNWRQATVLADAVTLLSKNYRFGFRNEGDFDLRNNVGAAAVDPRKQQGFFNNNFVTNGLTSEAFSNTGNLVGTGGLTDANYKTGPALDSSYFTNFATPVQRRAKFPEYLMEVCMKLPVSECKADDWYVDPVGEVRANTPGGGYAPAANFKAGTTAKPPDPTLQRFPRRVAFERNSSHELTGGGPLGITGGAASPGVGDLIDNSLWFATVDGASINYNGTSGEPYALNTNVNDWNNQPLPTTTSGNQPLLMPVLQIQTVKEDTGSGSEPPQGDPVKGTGWITRATETTFNLIIGSGDIPSRKLGSTTGDFNGGLQNLPRFLESWNNGTQNIKTKIQGSFVQLNRSAYSTGPYQPILPVTSPQRQDDTKKLKSLFTPPTTPPPTVAYTASEILDTDGNKNPGYKIDSILIPFFIPPARDWGFDVGQLSQPPDLFTQRFTTPPRKTEPAEYFREVPRNDEWVTTLMCGVIEDGGAAATSSRPSNCPT